MSRHRAEPIRPRYGRIAALGSSLTITAIAVLGSVGVLPSGDVDRPAAPPAAADAISQPDADGTSPTPVPTPVPTPAPSASSSSLTARLARQAAREDTSLPAESGDGKRAIFSQGRQRVWLVDDDGSVERTYLASGSVLDNLRPGTYSVYSRSRWAVGVDDSGVMQYFVRFTKGPSGAAIGFHTIPTKGGAPLQSVAQLGTPRSHGCIRQKTSDAEAMWDFAPVGTEVVVTA